MEGAMDKAVGYVRVSRVGGRDGDSFLSPDHQRESVERVCAREGLELVDVLEELDRSGGDSARPLWNAALERVERGEVQAFVVWNFSRFSRSAADAELALRRIESAGGRLLSESESFDTSTPEGRFARRTLFSMAEMERERAANSFRRAGASAIERGIHFASRVPFGYTRDPGTRKLVPDGNAPTVVELFERRAKRQGWFALARWLVERGASPKTNPAAVRWMVRNRAYLGEARSGEFVNRKAHPAIVTRLLFDRANAVHGRAPKKDGSITRHLLRH
jgi:site-specific DNA recombinase